MRLVLDSHIWLYYLAFQTMLPERVIRRIDHASTVTVSTVSLYELSLKAVRGRLRGLSPPDIASLQEASAERAISFEPLSARQAMAAGSLDDGHGDPFDRMILSLAKASGAVLVTADGVLLGRADVETLDARTTRGERRLRGRGN